MKKTYSINYSPYKGRVDGKDISDTTKVTEAKEITVYGMDMWRCPEDMPEGDVMKNYNKVYKSIYGFTFEQIISLIKVTNMSYISDLDLGEDYSENLSLASFEFNSVTNTIYPSYDS